MLEVRVISENIKIKYLKVNIQMSYLMSSLKFLKKQTKVSSFSDAMTLIHFKDLTREENEYVSMLITLWRAWKDGDIDPPVNIEDIYSECEMF